MKYACLFSGIGAPLQMELSSLKMENITLRVRDSMRYKQAGNSMTVAVLEMIFRQIEKAKEKDPQSLF